MLKDINELLEKLPIWKRIKESPDRIDALEKRIETLEKKLAGGDDICPKCKEPKFELISSTVHKRKYKCSNCGFEESTLR